MSLYLFLVADLSAFSVPSFFLLVVAIQSAMFHQMRHAAYKNKGQL